MRDGSARGWPYIVTGTAFAGICAWISYNDGLFVARLAGNHDRLAYFYPLLPDGLIVLALVALVEAARAGAARSRWAVAGLALGAAATLAMNTGAGVAHSALDAVIDGLIPVFFFIGVEIVLWHVRHARAPAVRGEGIPVTGAVPSSALQAARMRLEFAAEHGFRVTPNDTQRRFGLTRAAARDLHAGFAPERGQGGASAAPPAARSNAPALATQDPAGAALNGAGPRG